MNGRFIAECLLPVPYFTTVRRLMSPSRAQRRAFCILIQPVPLMDPVLMTFVKEPVPVKMVGNKKIQLKWVLTHPQH